MQTALDKLVRKAWLLDGPIVELIPAFIDTMGNKGYRPNTINTYLKCLAHFSYWLSSETIAFSQVDRHLIDRFLHDHLPVCLCPPPCYRSLANVSAALSCLSGILIPTGLLSNFRSPVETEITQFQDYLVNICGYSSSTIAQRTHHVRSFLHYLFGNHSPETSILRPADIEGFFHERCRALRPSSMRTICTCLRSYLRFRALQGDKVEFLNASLPRFADWKRDSLPKSLSDTESDAFLRSFDLSDPIGLRDYAIARCLLDLGLRGCEATHLTLDSIDWRNGTITISGTKAKREQRLPLPPSTGKAVAHYLSNGRPPSPCREVFIRHRAPWDMPLGVPAIRSAMNRAFERCGLRHRFCNTHVLRRTLATRLQRSGSSIKEIADLLRHQSIDTAKVYARVDMEGLRTVVMTWPERAIS